MTHYPVDYHILLVFFILPILLDQMIWRQEWHLEFYYAAFEMLNLLIARTFHPFHKSSCCCCWLCTSSLWKCHSSSSMPNLESIFFVANLQLNWGQILYFLIYMLNWKWISVLWLNWNCRCLYERTAVVKEPTVSISPIYVWISASLQN